MPLLRRRRHRIGRFRVRRRAGIGHRLRRLAGQHDDAGADLHAAVEILDVLVEHADAAGRNIMADGRGLVGAVDAVERVAEIHGARAERIARPARHLPRQIRLALDHFRRREPIRPFLHLGNALGAGPGEALAADAHAVADRLAAAEHQIEVGVRGIDNNGAGRLLGGKVDQLPLQVRRQFLGLALLGLILRRQRGGTGRRPVVAPRPEPRRDRN